MPVPSPTAKQSAWLVLAMLAMLAVPAGITLHSVHLPVAIQIQGANPTPHGYTWSLLLFVVPILFIAGWLLPSEDVRIPRLAFWRTIAILVPIGFGLDFFFANRFFVYPNIGATLGIGAPALGGPVPVEEYIFYFTGFVAILLIYVWLSEYWLAAYTVHGDSGGERRLRRLLQFHPASAIAAAALIAAAILYKKLCSPVPGGFPGYFTLLVVGGLVPSAVAFPVARPLVNWRAFSLTVFMILLVSLFWEATLAVPYGWWGYQQRQMMGLFIGAWAGLPIEAVSVWISVTYGTVIVYEIVKLRQRHRAEQTIGA